MELREYIRIARAEVEHTPRQYEDAIDSVIEAAEKWAAYLYCNPVNFNEDGRNKYIDEILAAYRASQEEKT